jgi:isoleucyl-tRNA synthetase
MACRPSRRRLRDGAGGERLILAGPQRDATRPSSKVCPGATIKGADLVGRTYEPRCYCRPQKDGAFRIVAGDFIEMGEGTGVVHMAPAFGEDDLNVGQKEGLPVVDPVDLEGNFTSLVPPYQGKNVFDANKDIIRDLKAAGVVLRHETYDHNYPHCWRTDQPLIYKAMPSWYVKVTAFRDRMVELNRDITWVPEHIRDCIFGNWLANARAGISAATVTGARRSRCGSPMTRPIRGSTATARSTRSSAISACVRRTCIGRMSTS